MSIDSTYNRVTEVLYPFSGLGYIDEAILSNAAKRGTRVHAACEAIVSGEGVWDADDEIRGYVHSFEKWWSKGHKVLSMEQRFYCSKRMITGQVDLIIDTPDGAIVLDIKTPAKPSKTWQLQGSAYAHLARQVGYNIKGIHFLQLNKHGMEPTLHVYDEDWEMFCKCLDVYNHFFKKKKPNELAESVEVAAD